MSGDCGPEVRAPLGHATTDVVPSSHSHIRNSGRRRKMKRLAIGIAVLALCLPAFAGDNKNNQYDPGIPDLIVSDNLGSQWVVRVEDFPATFCSVQEGDVDPGTHAVVRFTVTTPNIGVGDLRIGDPNVHVAADD